MQSKVKSVFDLERHIEGLLQQICQKTKVDAVTFHYYDKLHDRLILPAAVGLKNPARFKSWRPSMDRVAGRIMRSTKPMFFEDAQRHGEVNGPFVLAEGIRSSAGLPLVTKLKERIGILFFNYRTKHSFSADEKTALKVTADEAADAINDLFTLELRKELEEHSGLPREQIALQEIADGVEKALEDIAVAIWAPEPGKQSLAIKAQSGPTGRFVEGTKLELTQPSIVTDAFKSGKQCNAKLEDEPTFMDDASQMRWLEVWAFPVRSGSEILGVLCVWTVGHYDLTEREKRTIGAFVELAARTFENERIVSTLNILQDVGTKLTSIAAEPDKLMEDMVKSAALVLEADKIVLHQYNPEERQFYDSFSYGNGVTQPLKKPPRESGASAYVLDYGLLIVEDLDEVLEEDREMVRSEYIVKEEVKAYIGIRLRANEKTLGVIFFYYLHPQRFSPNEIAISEMFAAYASTAIQNTRTYQELESKNQELESVHELASAISKILDLNELMKAVLRSINGILGFGYARISLVDNERQMIETRRDIWEGEFDKYPEWTEMSKYTLDDKDILPDIVRSGEIEIISGWDDPRFNREIIEKYFDVHEHLVRVFIPISFGDTILGVIEAGSTDEAIRTYNLEDSEVRLLQTFVAQAAVGIHNAQLYGWELEQANRWSRDLAALNEIGQELTTRGLHLDQNQILDIIYTQTSKLMDTREMYIALYDSDIDVVSFGLVYEGGKPVLVGEESYAPRKGGKGATEFIIREKKPLFFRTAQEANDWYDQSENEEYTGFVPERYGYLGVPMMVGQRVLGVIAVQNHEADFIYGNADLQVLETIASQAAIAINNARLYEQAARLRQEAVAHRQLGTLGIAFGALQHRINNTFNIIVPNVTRLRKRIDLENEENTKILDIIERNARYTSEIIARIQEPLKHIEIQTVDINALLTEIIGKTSDQWRTTSSKTGIKVITHLDDSIPLIQVSSGQLAEVFRNLIDNAHRAMDKGGQLKISSKLIGKAIQVRVQDSGGGIPDSIRERLFDKPVPSRELGGGAGLGLWLNHLILQSIGGNIMIAETSPTIGTTMLVEIPAFATEEV